MDRRMYDKTRDAEFRGRKVKSLVKLSNGLYAFPAGITWTIRRKQGGFEMISDPYPHCGIQAFICKVPPGDVDFTDNVPLWPPPEGGPSTHQV